MSIFLRNGAILLGTLAAFGSLVGCGESTNNDQGTSFLALGFYEDGEGEVGDVGTTVYLNRPTAGSQGVFPLQVPIDKDTEEEGVQGGFLGLENRLSEQFIRTVRADCSYEVPGADPGLSIPNDAYNFTTVIPPSVSEGEGEAVTFNRSYAQIAIVSPQVLAFLNSNVSRLPELPMRLTATCSATGVTQAGDVLTTNPVNYQVTFAECPSSGVSGLPGCSAAGDPSVDGPGTGGDLEDGSEDDGESDDIDSGSSSDDTSVSNN